MMAQNNFWNAKQKTRFKSSSSSRLPSAFASFASCLCFFAAVVPLLLLSPQHIHCEAWVEPRSLRPFRRTTGAQFQWGETSLFSFKQQPGESDIDFIKRITNQSSQLASQAEASALASTGTDDSSSASGDEMEEKPRGKYQKIEDWNEENKVKGENTWEQKLQFDGQRTGNKLRQNDILIRNLHTF